MHVARLRHSGGSRNPGRNASRLYFGQRMDPGFRRGDEWQHAITFEQLLAISEISVITIKLQIQYCGGCNPEIDRGSLVTQLKQLIESDGIKPIFCKDEQADWLILVNGCARACLEEQFPESRTRPRRISIQGNNFNYRPVAENELPRTIWNMMRKRDS